MMFIELFAPRGALGQEARGQLGRRLIEAMSEGGAPEGVIEAWRAISQVVVHEVDTWVVGGQPLDQSAPPRYVVRVSVPGPWRREMSGEVIARIIRALADSDSDPQRLYREPHAWVHLIGVPDGSYGTCGQALQSSDLIEMITRPFREAPAGDRPAAAPGTAIDPVCGMTVALTETAITLEHEGATYAFCSTGCRAFFAASLKQAGRGNE